jgi:hypothetical protein
VHFQALSGEAGHKGHNGKCDTTRFNPISCSLAIHLKSTKRVNDLQSLAAQEPVPEVDAIIPCLSNFKEQVVTYIAG